MKPAENIHSAAKTVGIVRVCADAPVPAEAEQIKDEWTSPAVIIFPQTSRPEEAGLHHPESAGEGRGAEEPTDQDLQVSFFQKGILQVYAQRHRLQLGPPQYVLPGVLQCCLSYSLITRLAPHWNKAGLLLISGRDFLTEKGRMNAVSMELSTTEGQLCISIGASAVRMPPNTLEDFDFPPLVLKRFNSDPDFILDPSCTGAAIWCHVLPRLPEVTQEEVVYCSVYFRLVGERLFTYPLSCIRLQPVQHCPAVNLEGALGSFVSDIRTRLQSVCGFPARLSSKPCYHTVGLNAAATVQELSPKQVNLTTSSTTRQVLTQLPAPPAYRTVKPFFGSQPPPWSLLSQQDQAQGLTQTQGAEEDKNLPLSSSSFSRDSYSSSCQTVLSFSTSFPPPLQPVSSLTSSISPSPLPPLSQHQLNPAPKLVPVFRNKRPSCHISVAELRLQKLQQQQRGNMVDRGKVIIPTFGKNEPSTAALASSTAYLPTPPPPIVPRFKPKTQSSSTREPSAHLKHIFSLRAALQSKPGLILPSKAEIKLKPKSVLKTRSDSNTSSSKPPAASPEAPQPSLSSVVSKKHLSSSVRRRVVFESKVKKSRAMIQDLDVERMARNSQLSKLKSATLLAWLKGRGIVVSTKCKKEELMLKVTLGWMDRRVCKKKKKTSATSSCFDEQLEKIWNLILQRQRERTGILALQRPLVTKPLQNARMKLTQQCHPQVQS
ncbi:putative protein C18orf63 [Channa argus]|uniref:DUF4708 domain-containing protein n=1 Tax=Channa argus TaxID=215402 RepID=A0A6G1QMJ5_CHAAH|nr:putative protein C18orf63 [Channa argus]